MKVSKKEMLFHLVVFQHVSKYKYIYGNIGQDSLLATIGIILVDSRLHCNYDDILKRSTAKDDIG